MSVIESVATIPKSFTLSAAYAEVGWRILNGEGANRAAVIIAIIHEILKSNASKEDTIRRINTRTVHKFWEK